MYEFLEGRLAGRGATRVVVDVGGVGYDVAIPLGVDFAPAAGGGDGERVRVWTHQVVREDSHRLFGFPNKRMREIFRLLLQVRGVGPGLALAILSSLPGELLLEAVASGDATAFTRIKGVGKKTADQILLDLRDRAPKPAEEGIIVPRPPGESQTVADAIRALTSIGYAEKDARKSVERAARTVDPGNLELLVRAALQGGS